MKRVESVVVVEGIFKGPCWNGANSVHRRLQCLHRINVTYREIVTERCLLSTLIFWRVQEWRRESFIRYVDVA